MVRLYRAASYGLAHLPLEPTVAVARVGFLVGYVLWPEKRRNIQANAAHVLRLPADHPEVARLSRRIYSSYARYVVELMRLPSLPPGVPAESVALDGERGLPAFERYYEGEFAGRRAMIIVTAHIGNIETLAAAVTARRGFPAYGVADDSAYPELYELLREQRRRWGVEVISWRNLREIYRVLDANAMLALLVDWGYRSDGIPVRLFGSWTTLPAGPAVLAAKTGAAIVPVLNRRRPDGRYEVEYGETIEVADGSPAEVQRATQAIADALERWISVAPEQWYSFKPIWPAPGAEEVELEARAREAQSIVSVAGHARRRSPLRQGKPAPPDPDRASTTGSVAPVPLGTAADLPEMPETPAAGPDG